LTHAEPLRLLDESMAERNVAEAQPAMPEQDLLLVRLAAGTVADHDLAELRVE
jgi:hypothetical protein